MVKQIEGLREHLSEKIIVFIFFSLFLINSSYAVWGDGSYYNAISYSTKAIIFVSIIFNYRCILNLILSSKGLWIIICIILFGFNYVITWSKEGFLSEFTSFWLNVFPVILLLLTVNEHNILFRKLVNMSKIIAILSILVLVFRRTGSYEYSMGLANSMVLPGICLLYDYFRNSKLTSLIGTMIIATVIIIMGSRGALLELVVYFAFKTLKEIDSHRHKIRTILMIIAISIGFLLYDRILEVIQDILAKFGIYSRTIYILINLHGHFSGREEIYTAILDAVKSAPFAVRGIGSSFAVTGGAFAHNIFLQLLCEGGVLFGGIAIVFIVWNCGKTIIIRNNTVIEELILVFFSASVPRLFFSGSIWSSPELWCWIILLIVRRKDYGKDFIEYSRSNQE